MSSSQSRTLLILLALVLIFNWITPVLVMDGMFMDGQQYSNVAMNMAEGKGSFWKPVLTDTWIKSERTEFTEHPPMGFFLQSLMFRLLGNGFFTERIFFFLCLILAIALIILHWKFFEKEGRLKQGYAALPVVLFLLIPVSNWAFSNGVLEIEMTLVTLSASLFFLYSTLAHSYTKYFWLILSSLAVGIAFLVKGVPGLFPLSLPLIYRFTIGKKNHTWVMDTLVMLLVFSLLIAILLWGETSGDALMFYLKNRLLYRINEEPTVENHFFILERLLIELLIPIACSLWFLRYRLLKKRDALSFNSIYSYFFLIGFAASLPLVITAVQRGFYLVPAFPFFALAFGAVIADSFADWFSGLKYIVYKIAFGLLVVVGAIGIYRSISNVKFPSRDIDELLFCEQIKKVVPPGEIVALSPSLYDNWSLQMYLYRKLHISCDAKFQRTYLIAPISEKAELETKSDLVVAIGENPSFVLFQHVFAPIR